jgi:hypothetical protein
MRTRHLRKRRQVTRRRRGTHRGGKRLGRGVSGIVYTPVLQCDDSSHTQYAGTAFVSKAVPGHKVESELANADAVRTLDPAGDYTIVPLHSCALAVKQTNANFLRNKNDPNNTYENNETRNGQRKIYSHQVIYRNGGKSLGWWLGPKNHITSCVIAAIKEFIPYLVEFNKHYIHFDLHMDNLVYDGERIRMIDFEKMGPVRPEIQTADLCNLLMNLYGYINAYGDAKVYGGWLAQYKQLADYPFCARSASVADIVACIMALPVVKKSVAVGCSIMG